MTVGYSDLVSGCAAVLLPRDVVRVAGPEAITYLQGQLSQDVAALAEGASSWSLILQPQGKVDAWVRITRTKGDEVIIDVDGGYGALVQARLARFKLRTKADIDALDWSCVAVRGPAAAASAAAASAAAASSVPTAGAIVCAQANWPLIGGWDLLGPAPTAPPGIPAASLEAYEIRRIEAGLPRMGSELTEATIPAEAGVVESSVSFTKGCYTGQELVARIDSRGGHVPRRIRRVRISGEAPPEVGSAIVSAGRQVGTLTSAAAHPDGYVVGLASVHRDVDTGAAAECAGRDVVVGEPAGA